MPGMIFQTRSNPASDSDTRLQPADRKAFLSAGLRYAVYPFPAAPVCPEHTCHESPAARKTRENGFEKTLPHPPVPGSSM